MNARSVEAAVGGHEPALRVDAVTKSFAGVQALRGVSFEAPRGSVLGILGPNGAGKTTLVDILCTLLAPDSGQAQVVGYDVATQGAAVREVISITRQYSALDETLNGRDNLIFFGRMRGLRRASARRRADYLLERFDLVEAADRVVSGYSGGMRRRLDIACGLVVEPAVMFLDEPTTGLDPRSRQAVWALIEALKADGITTLLTTQYLDEADRLADNIIVIDRGQIVAEGSAEALKRKVGGTFCQVVLADPSRVSDFGDLLISRLGSHHRIVATQEASITLSASDGVDTIAQVIEVARTAGVRLADIGLRNPSLDDVFLTLTGDHPDTQAGR